MEKPIDSKKCKRCGILFYRVSGTKKSHNWKKRRFCSPGCYYKARIGGKGKYKGYWTGKRLPDETLKRISETLKAKPFTPRKKEKDLGYHQKHKRLNRSNGKPGECEFCGKVGESKNGRWTIEWAKKHGHEYTIKSKDYIPLCHKCHHHYDTKFIG